MKIGNLMVTPKGLEAIARAGRTLNAKIMKFEVHKDDDTHGIIRLCVDPKAGWIDLMEDFDK